MPRASVKTPVPDEAVPPADDQAPVTADDTAAVPAVGPEHVCHTADGQDVPCLCIRGVDHTEAEFDVPLDAPAADDQTPTADTPPPTGTPEAAAPKATPKAGRSKKSTAPTGFVVVATIFMWIDDEGRKQRARKGDIVDGLPTSVAERGLRNGTLAQQD